MKPLFNLVFLLVFLLVKNDRPLQDNFRYKKVPVKYLKNYEKVINKVDYNNSYDLVKSLPTNYFSDASVDYTDYMQDGIDKHNNVKMPDFPVLINYKGLKLHSENIIFFQKKSRLIIKPNNKTSYAGLRVQNVNNVQIINSFIIGDRNKHMLKEGQWGMGITVKGAKNVSIVNPNITNCWGDGIYIGDKSDGIVIKGGVLDNNRRNGLSIVSGKNITITNTLMANSNGQMPMSGIDIEPNNNEDVLENILLDKVITYNNFSHGIIVSPGSLKGANSKQISIEINNHIDEYSKVGLGLISERLKKKSLRGIPLTGKVKIVNPIWKYNQTGFKDYGNLENKIRVNFEGVKIIKNVSGKDVADDKGLIEIKRVESRNNNNNNK